MSGSTTSPIAAAHAGSLRLYRVLTALALIVPALVDPFGSDTQGFKGLLLALIGCTALLVAAFDVGWRARRPRLAGLPGLCLALVTLWSGMSLAWAVNVPLGATRLLVLLGMCGLALCVCEACRTASDVRRVVLGMLLVGSVALAFDAVAIRDASAALTDTTQKHASIVFVHTNMAATFVTMLAPLIVALALDARRFVVALAWLALLGAFMAYLGLLGSRAGMLGALLAVVVVGALFLLRRRPELRRAPVPRARWLAAGLIVLCGLLPFSERARGWAKEAFYSAARLTAVDMADISFRPLLWRKTLEMASQDPWRGVGAGNFVVEFPRFERQASPKPHAHNDALQVLAELGLPGLLLFLALLLALLASLWRTLCTTAAGAAFPLAAGLFGSVVVFVAGGQFEVPFALAPTAADLALVIGLAAVLRRRDAPTEGPAAGMRATGALRTGAVLLGVLLVPALWSLVSRLPGSSCLVSATRLAAAGDLPGAAALCERVNDMHTGSFVPHQLLGQLSLAQDDGAAALQHFRRARALWPWSSELAENEGDACTALGLHADAVACYRGAYDASPTRVGPFFKLVLALDKAGRLREATEMLQYRVRTFRATTMDTVQRLADMWRRLALDGAGAPPGTAAPSVAGESARIEALVASRHFYAVVLQEADAGRMEECNRSFKDVTHRLQILPGSPASWWAVYETFRAQNSLRMPYTALWTSMDGDAKRLFPGYVEPLGPPVPDLWREPP